MAVHRRHGDNVGDGQGQLRYRHLDKNLIEAFGKHVEMAHFGSSG